MTVPIRIAIDGVQSTGKTTLFERLKQTYAAISSFIPEASREVAPLFGIKEAKDWQGLLANVPKLRQFFDAEQEWLFHREDIASKFLVDSSFLVICAYRLYFGLTLPIEISRRTYDVILYCPQDFEATVDGFRFVEGRKDIDAHYRQLITSFHRGRFEIVPCGPDREAFAVKLLDEILYEPGRNRNA